MRVLVISLLLCFAFPSYANENVVAARALSGDEIALQDGRALRLSDIKAAAPEAKTFLDSLVSGKILDLRDASMDRYGRVTATAVIDGAPSSIEEALLREGLAFVYPAVGDERLDALFAAEGAARLDKRGFWANSVDVASKDAAKLCGMYGFVVGAVTKAERVGNKVHLSFGAQERPEFMIVVALRHAHELKKRGIDVLSLQGKTVRVRGWVADSAVPAIVLTDSHQLELTE